MQITQLLNGNCFTGRNGWKPKWLILHGTAGGSSALEIAQFFVGTEGTDNPVSAHYIVDEQGIIYQATLEQDGAWGNGVVTTGHDPWWDENGNPNPNNVTISIEHVKPDSANATPITQAQQAASFALIKDICIRNGIPMRAADANGGIAPHASIDPVNRSRCPGTFDWDALWAYLNGETMMTIDLTNGTVASHFSGDNNIWKCKDNGFLVGYGILGFYRQFGGTALCGLTFLGLPRSGELAVPGHPGVTQQEFERGTIRYDPDHVTDFPPGAGDCYVIHVEQDPRNIATQAQLSKLQTQNSLLQSQVADLQNQLDTNVQAQTISALEAKITAAQKDLS